MSNGTTVNNYHSFPVLGLLGVAFVILKLMGYINWSWWWVLAPFWVPIAVLLVIAIIVGLVALIIAAVNK